jgi:hypothetical protein
MSSAETQLVLRHNLELSNPAIASRDLDLVGAASITSLSVLEMVASMIPSGPFSSPRGIEEESPGLDQVSSSVFRAPESQARAGMSATLQSRCVSENWISSGGRRIVIVPKEG